MVFFVCMDELYSLGWYLCAARMDVCKHWKGDLLFKKNRHLFILETKRGPLAAKITADLIAPTLSDAGFNIYYGYLDHEIFRIRGIHEWSRKEHIKTICI